MKKNKHIEILKNLSTTEYITSAALALALGISDRTVRTVLKQLKPILSENGATLIIRPHYGIKIDIHDYQRYHDFYNREKKKMLDSMKPVEPGERVEYLIGLLISSNDYILLDDLAEQLFVSRNSLTGDLKKVRRYFSRFNLDISQTPNYGLRLRGSEINIRKCLLERELIHHDNLEQFLVLLSQINELLNRHNYRCLGYALDEITSFFIVASTRINHGNMITETTYSPASQEMGFIREIFSLLLPETKELCSNELNFALIFIKSRLSFPLESPHLFKDIDFESQNIIVRLLKEISRYYQVNLFDNHDYDIELRNHLAGHLGPMRIRIENDIQLHNPILLEIKQNHTFAFMLAKIACQYLSSFYKKEITQDEIGYIAIFLDTAIKKRTTFSNEKNIMLVCDYGIGSQQLLKFQFEQTFTRHIKNIEVTDSHNLPAKLSNIDYIFTTSPLEIAKKPAMEISLDLTDYQIDEIKKILRTPFRKFYKPAFSLQFFYPNLNLKSKDDVIDFIIDQFVDQKKIQPRLAPEIKNREKAADSFFANSTAILNPVHTSYKETIVSVCILNRPIKWGDHRVSLIITILNDQILNRYLLRFFDVISKLVLDHDKVREIINKKDFNTLLAKFDEVEKSVPK